MSDNYDTLKFQADAIKAKQARRAIDAATTEEKVLSALDLYYGHEANSYAYSEALIARMRLVLQASHSAASQPPGAATPKGGE